MPTRNSYREPFTVLLMLFFIIGCNSKDQQLEAYYSNNTKLHQELSDSLMNFSKKYKREITLKKTQFADQHIRLDISFPERAESLPIFFDTSYNRHDYSEKTSEFAVPKGLIENFGKSIYFGISSDSTYTFFAYEWNRPKNLIGTSGDSQYGILVLKDTVELNKRDKRISKNACIASYGLF
jgi:hypothetical protein